MRPVTAGRPAFASASGRTPGAASPSRPRQGEVPHRPLQPLLTHTLVELLDLHAPNLKRQLAIDLLLSCGNLMRTQAMELALGVLQDVAPVVRDPQVSQLIGANRASSRTAAGTCGSRAA